MIEITVHDLMNHLSTMPQDSLVVLSGDSEGNRFEPLYALGEYLFTEDDWHMGSLLSIDDPNPPEHARKAVVLWP